MLEPELIQPQQAFTLNSKTWQCWAHTRSGHRCTTFVKRRTNNRDGPIPIPYCNRHLASGDGAVKVVKYKYKVKTTSTSASASTSTSTTSTNRVQEVVGHCLVARIPLPPKYRLGFHGHRGRCQHSMIEDRAISFYPPNSKGNNKDKDGNQNGSNYNGVLNPGGTGDVIQFAACPGPNERQNMRSTFTYWGKRNGDYGGLEFKTLEVIPQNTQLCHWYGSGWWSARGVKRFDIGTVKYPAPLRLRRQRVLDTDAGNNHRRVQTKKNEKVLTTPTNNNNDNKSKKRISVVSPTQEKK